MSDPKKYGQGFEDGLRQSDSRGFFESIFESEEDTKDYDRGYKQGAEEQERNGARRRAYSDDD